MTDTASAKAPIAAAIQAKLTAALAPAHLRLHDDSHRHTKHAAAPDRTKSGGETHFRVEVVSDRFTGLSRVDRHRLVNEILADEFAAGVHALSIDAKTPAEVR